MNQALEYVSWTAIFLEKERAQNAVSISAILRAQTIDVLLNNSVVSSAFRNTQHGLFVLRRKKNIVLFILEHLKRNKYNIVDFNIKFYYIKQFQEFLLKELQQNHSPQIVVKQILNLMVQNVSYFVFHLFLIIFSCKE